MKKITLFYLFILSSIFLNAQDISWSKPIKTNNAREVVEYIGSAEENNFFISYTSKESFFYSKIETYLFKTNSNNEFKGKSERVIFEDTEIIKAFMKDNKINLLIKEYKKKNYVIELVVYDANTMKEIVDESKVLIQVEVDKTDKLIVYYAESKDKSKYCLNYLAVDKKTSKGYLQMNVFENDNTALWTSRFENDFEGRLSIHDFHIENSGDIYLYAINKIPITKKKADYKLLIVNTNESGGRESEYSISLDNNISSMSFYVLDSNTVFLATQNDEFVNTYKLDLEQEDIKSSNKFKIYEREDKGYSWVLSKFYQLDNGNLVLPIENKWSTKYITNGSASYSYSNTNISFALIDPQDNQVISKTYIAREMNFYTTKYLQHGYFEMPYYFTDGNDFYAIYNNKKKYDDLNSKFVNYISTTKAKGSKKFHTMMLKIDESGEARVNKLFSMKIDKKMFSPYTSFINKNNELIISGGNKNGFSFTNYNYK